MKNKLALLIGTIALALTGCSTSDPSSNPESSNDNPNSSAPIENNYSQVLKDCATQIMRLNAAEASATLAKRGFEPQDAPGQALSFPAVYLYWAGLLNDIEGVDIVGKAIYSTGTYQFGGMGDYIQEINFDISVDFDITNNKFTFLGRQSLPTNPVTYSYLVLTCNYNFTTRAFGGFSALMTPDSDTSGNYMRYNNGVFEMYTFSNSDGHETDPDYIEYHPIAVAGRTRLDALMESKNVLEGAALQESRLAFKAASDFCDEITAGTDFDVEIVED